nr:MAG TPA: hypothetical protein [Caudoviricetes sp.]
MYDYAASRAARMAFIVVRRPPNGSCLTPMKGVFFMP